MIYKQTWINVSDNSNVLWVKTFHLYKGFYRKVTSESYFIKSSARLVEPPRLIYKGFKKQIKRKGSICRLFLIRTTKTLTPFKGISYTYSKNAGLLLRKKTLLTYKHVFGLVSKNLKRKKFLSLFPYIL